MYTGKPCVINRSPPKKKKIEKLLLAKSNRKILFLALFYGKIVTYE